jgi:hypothetical protein
LLYGPNAYEAFGNSPVNRIDPSGWNPFDPDPIPDFVHMTQAERNQYTANFTADRAAAADEWNRTNAMLNGNGPLFAGSLIGTSAASRSMMGTLQNVQDNLEGIYDAAYGGELTDGLEQGAANIAYGTEKGLVRLVNLGIRAAFGLSGQFFSVPQIPTPWDWAIEVGTALVREGTAQAAPEPIVAAGAQSDSQTLAPGHGRNGADQQPSDDELRRYDKKRKKTVSNDTWVSKTDPDARITKMKDGRTHLAYKAEHVVDLDSDMLLAAEIRPADHADPHTLVDSVIEAKINLETAGSEVEIEEVAADKGYHANATLELAADLGLRTYIPEPRLKDDRVWTDKPAEFQRAVVNNRRRMARAKGKRFGRLRSERVERSFAHVCDTGGARRSWLRGLEDVTKRYRLAAAAHNLARIMRLLFGIGKPRALQAPAEFVWLVQFIVWAFWHVVTAVARVPSIVNRQFGAPVAR